MGTLRFLILLFLFVVSLRAQQIQQHLDLGTNIVINAIDITATNNFRINNILTFEDTNSVINIGANAQLGFRASADHFRLLLSDSVADVSRFSYGFGSFLGTDIHPEISWVWTDQNVIEFTTQDRASYLDTRQRSVFVAGNVVNTNTYFSPTETNFSTAGSLVLNLQTSSSYQRVIVTNNFIFGVTNFFHGVAMAVKFDPVDKGSNYTITLDSSWERYGTNFGSTEVIIQPTKAAILSVTSYGGSAADVAASIRYQR